MHLISFLYQERTESFSHNCSEKILGEKKFVFHNKWRGSAWGLQVSGGGEAPRTAKQGNIRRW